VTYIQLRKGIY